MTIGNLVILLSLCLIFQLFLLVRLNWVTNKLHSQIELMYRLNITWARNWGKDTEEMKKALDNIIYG